MARVSIYTTLSLLTIFFTRGSLIRGVPIRMSRSQSSIVCPYIIRIRASSDIFT